MVSGARQRMTQRGAEKARRTIEKKKEACGGFFGCNRFVGCQKTRVISDMGTRGFAGNKINKSTLLYSMYTTADIFTKLGFVAHAGVTHLINK
jgi:hypothetical protein